MQPVLEARKRIDVLLEKSGWIIQDRHNANATAGTRVAVREFLFGSGEADYGLFVDGKAIGAVEAKPAGTTLSSVAAQTEKYLTSLPANFSAWHKPEDITKESAQPQPAPQRRRKRKPSPP